MTDETDPLASLLLDSVEVDRARIASVLKNLVGIDRESGRIVPKPAFSSLSNRRRVLAVLLAVKASELMSVTDSHAVRAGDIPKLAGVPEGSAHPILKDLRDSHRVSQTTDGLYYFSDHNVLDALAEFEMRDSDSIPASDAEFDRPRQDTRSQNSKGSKPATSTQLGPKRMLDTLLEDGWFDNPRTLSDVAARMKDRWARDVKVTSISPYFSAMTRSGELERQKNEKGVYEYWRAS